MNAFAASDTGRQRPANEDSYCVEADIGLLAVADGVGGRSAGSIASSLAIQVLKEKMTERLLHASHRSPLDLLSEAMETANSAILKQASGEPEYQGMSTTLTACMFRDETAYFAHVGDCRAYLLREGRLVQLTEDHTLDNLRRQLRGREVGETPKTRQSSQLLSALGISTFVASDLFARQVLPGDLIALCTDGLVAHINDNEICRVLGLDLPISDRVSKLLAIANERGGRDNITLVVAVCT